MEVSLKIGATDIFSGPNVAEVLLKPNVADPSAAIVLHMPLRPMISNDVGSQSIYLLFIFPEGETNRWYRDRPFLGSHLLLHILQALSRQGPLLDEELSGEGLAAENKRLKAELTAREQTFDKEMTKLKATVSKTFLGGILT
ncbi:nucleoid occlusion factor SlmA [Striga asiatica]|uniref:Nucleoid occlusion factor SlmA n=1 Tax=Striga asiatica TaxID=4170 RepID=A0A5A7PXN6_STRAF|nr:nucleoid occlusion factor SlmA [Striga asiatica]